MTDPQALTTMTVVLSIPHRDPRSMAWWGDLARHLLGQAVRQTGRVPHGRIRAHVTHARQATVTATCDTRPA